MTEDKTTSSSRLLHVLTMALSALGIALCIVLVKSHRAVYAGGVSGGLFCGSAGLLGCDDVAASPRSWLLGFPVAGWGLLYFCVVLGVSVSAFLHRGPDRKSLLLAGVGVVALALAFDLYLAVVMIGEIGAICLNCLATYAVNVALVLGFAGLYRKTPGPASLAGLLPSWRALLDRDDATYYRNVMKLGSFGMVLAILAGAFAWIMVPIGQIRDYGDEQVNQMLARIEHAVPQVDMAALGDQPSSGPPDAIVDVVLVGDFQCSHCRSLAHTIRALTERWPGRIRQRFVNSPLNVTCNPAVRLDAHPDACWLAEVGECAAGQGRFWEYHDLVFRRLPLAEVDSASVAEHLSDIGLDSGAVAACLASGEARAAVEEDIDLLDTLGITVTPSTIINGQVKQGSMFPWMLERIVSSLMDRGSEEAEP